jgi:heat-inducible transcriptional repressor
MIPELNERSEAIFRFIVDNYLESGDPVGSKTISQGLGLSLSPASIRNVMANLENEGLLYAPHTSAGRLPTQQGLRFYVDGLMELGDVTHEEQQEIKARCTAAGKSMESLFDQALSTISGLSSAAGLVVAPKTNTPLKQIQFVPLDMNRILIVMVMQNGIVENRVMEVTQGFSEVNLTAAANYLNTKIAGHTIDEVRRIVTSEIATKQTQLDQITAELVQRGISLTPASQASGHIIVKGRTKLLEDVKAMEELEKARKLLNSLEEEQTMAKLLEYVESADGVQIYIGTENKMFEHSGWSMVISPYKDQQNTIIGAIGVIGPTRLNYSRVIPLLDYTSKVIEKIMGS